MSVHGPKPLNYTTHSTGYFPIKSSALASKQFSTGKTVQILTTYGTKICALHIHRPIPRRKYISIMIVLYYAIPCHPPGYNSSCTTQQSIAVGAVPPPKQNHSPYSDCTPRWPEMRNPLISQRSAPCCRSPSGCSVRKSSPYKVRPSSCRDDKTRAVLSPTTPLLLLSSCSRFYYYRIHLRSSAVMIILIAPSLVTQNSLCYFPFPHNKITVRSTLGLIDLLLWLTLWTTVFLHVFRPESTTFTLNFTTTLIRRWMTTAREAKFPLHTRDYPRITLFTFLLH